MKLSNRIFTKSNRMKCQKQYYTVHSTYKFVSQNEHLFYSITKDYYSPNIKKTAHDRQTSQMASIFINRLCNLDHTRTPRYIHQMIVL